MRRLARRYQHLTGEIKDADTELHDLVATAAPAMTNLLGVGVEVTGQLLSTVGDNPTRMRSEAAFAHLCAVAPIPASSGKTRRHRLNRGGDRGANNALYTVVLTRLRLDDRTRRLRGPTHQRGAEPPGPRPGPRHRRRRGDRAAAA